MVRDAACGVRRPARSAALTNSIRVARCEQRQRESSEDFSRSDGADERARASISPGHRDRNEPAIRAASAKRADAASLRGFIRVSKSNSAPKFMVERRLTRFARSRSVIGWRLTVFRWPRRCLAVTDNVHR